jgi:hypothetical protein
LTWAQGCKVGVRLGAHNKTIESRRKKMFVWNYMYLGFVEVLAGLFFFGLPLWVGMICKLVEYTAEIVGAFRKTLN